MEKKSFFKSTSFKCIVALLCVLLVSGIFLTVMNSLLAVTDQERFDRAINKIYGKSVKYEVVAVANYNDNATIDEAYRIKDDGNYLIKATGKGGYDNGTVTCWVVIEVKNGKVSGVGKVVVDSNKGQSYIGNISDKFLSAFTTAYAGGYFSPYDDGFVRTGATRSATAICNAVNGALDFVNAIFGNVAQDIYKDYEFAYRDVIDTRNTTHVVLDDESVVYTVATNGYGNAGEFTIQITVGNDGKIAEFNIVKNGSTSGFENSMDEDIRGGDWFVGKNAEEIIDAMGGGIGYGDVGGGLTSNGLSTGATQSSYLCINAAVFATANYEKCIELYKELGIGGGEKPVIPDEPDEPDEPDFFKDNGFEYIDLIDTKATEYTVNGDSVSYTVVTNGYRMAGKFTIQITVDNDGKIASFEILTNGSTDNEYKDNMPAGFLDGTWFVGKTLTDILAAFGGNEIDYNNVGNDLQTGATMSNYNCLQAAAFATANYQKCIELESNEGGND